MEGTESVVGGNTGGTSAPASFAEADWSAPAASPAAEPADQTSTRPAAEQPGSVQADSPQLGDERSPFIPRTRFDEVNTERNALREWKEQHSWADRDEVRQIVEQVAASKGDPLAFFARQFDELSGHPVFGPQIASFLGRRFGALGRQQAPAAPQVDLNAIQVDMGNGNAVSLADIAQQIRGDVLKEVAPKFQTLEQIESERQIERMTQQSEVFATQTMKQAEAWPGMHPEHDKANRQAVGKRIDELMRDVPREYLADERVVPFVLRDALKQAYIERVLPTLGAKAQSAMLDTLQQKAAANSSVNPGSAAPSTPRAYTSFHQLPADAWK